MKFDRTSCLSWHHGQAANVGIKIINKHKHTLETSEKWINEEQRANTFIQWHQWLTNDLDSPPRHRGREEGIPDEKILGPLQEKNSWIS